MFARCLPGISESTWRESPDARAKLSPFVLQFSPNFPRLICVKVTAKFLFSVISYLLLFCWMLDLPCYTFSFFSNTPCSLQSKLVLKAQIETRSFSLGARVRPLFHRKWSLNSCFDIRFILFCLIILEFLGHDYTLSALLSFLDEVNWLNMVEFLNMSHVFFFFFNFGKLLIAFMF